MRRRAPDVGKADGDGVDELVQGGGGQVAQVGFRAEQAPSAGCHSAWIVGQASKDATRLVEWAGQLPACGPRGVGPWGRWRA